MAWHLSSVHGIPVSPTWRLDLDNHRIPLGLSGSFSSSSFQDCFKSGSSRRHLFLLTGSDRKILRYLLFGLRIHFDTSPATSRLLEILPSPAPAVAAGARGTPPAPQAPRRAKIMLYPEKMKTMFSNKTKNEPPPFHSKCVFFSWLTFHQTKMASASSARRWASESCASKASMPDERAGYMEWTKWTMERK